MAITDSDGDGISDAFELADAGDLTTMNSQSDFDGDRTTDKDEYIAATNPLAPDEPLKITHIKELVGTKAVEMEWNSRPVRVYTVEGKTNLMAETWQVLGSVPGTPGATTTAAIESSVPNAFFRVSARIPLQP